MQEQNLKLSKFPPFYTKQPNLETWQKQLELWTSFILDYSRVNRIYTLRCKHQEVPFYNPDINRSLPIDAIRTVLEQLVAIKRGSWDKTKESCKVYWNTPNEWAEMIYNWAKDTGKIGTVCTLFELLQGDDVQSQEFCGLDEDIAKLALSALEKDKKATVFESTDKSIGVKFH